MSIKNEFKKIIRQLGERFIIPQIASVFFPPFYKGGQPKDSQFMAIVLEGGATGISYVLLTDNEMEAYNALRPLEFSGKDPKELALEFGNQDPIKEMISMASINAICQFVMKETNFQFDYVTDPLGLISIDKGDRIGMVGLFSGLIDTIRDAHAELIVIEKKEHLIQRFRDLPITLNVAELATCNKVLCTSTAVLNNSLDEILSNCLPDASVSIVGPTAGYFPDPLFACGVDVVGGRVVKDSKEFLQRLVQRKRWTDSTQKTCFEKKTYTSIINKKQ